jgi:hypothetical protein
LLAGAAEITMRDPLAYPNMLSAPLGRFVIIGSGLIALGRSAN